MTTQEAADTLLKIADRDQILKLIAEIEKAADANNGSVKLYPVRIIPQKRRG